MISYDFIDLEKKLDFAVIKMVSVFGFKEVTSISEAKSIIKNVLIKNKNTYNDYSDDSFRVISILISKIMASDIEGFVNILFSTTFLLESYLKSDDDTIDQISIIVGDLIDEFNKTSL